MATIYAQDQVLLNIPSGTVKLKLTCQVGGLSLTVYNPGSGEMIYEVMAGSQAIIETVPGMRVSFISLGQFASFVLEAE